MTDGNTWIHNKLCDTVQCKLELLLTLQSGLFSYNSTTNILLVNDTLFFLTFNVLEHLQEIFVSSLVCVVFSLFVMSSASLSPCHTESVSQKTLGHTNMPTAIPKTHCTQPVTIPWLLIVCTCLIFLFTPHTKVTLFP